MAAVKKTKAISNPAEMTGAQKTAVILLSLGEDHGGIWEMFDDEEIKEVSQAMSSLGAVSSDAVEQLIVDFVGKLSSAGSLMGSFDSTQRLLTAFLPTEKVESVMEEIRGPAGRTMWDKLGNVNEGVLANYLKNEYPQTVAVILSKVRGDHAARVLGSLPEDFALEVVMRIDRKSVV